MIIKKKLGIPRDPLLTVTMAVDKLQLAIQNQKRSKRYAAELQMEYRYRLAQAKEAEDNIAAATHVRNLTHQENTRALFRQIRYLERKINNLATTRVMISDKRGWTKEIVHQQKMECKLMMVNEHKYHQTEGQCSITQGRLLKDIGILGDGPRVKDILQYREITDALQVLILLRKTL